MAKECFFPMANLPVSTSLTLISSSLSVYFCSFSCRWDGMNSMQNGIEINKFVTGLSSMGVNQQWDRTNSEWNGVIVEWDVQNGMGLV